MDFIDLKNILLKDNPSSELRKRKDELATLIPEMAETYDFDQKTVWHPYDVFEHTMHTIDNTYPDIRLRLAGLFHDIGKPESMTIDEEGIGHFYGHWVESERIFINYQDKFDLSEEDIYLIRKLIFYHDLTINSTSLKRFLEEFDREGMNLLFALKEADIKAQNKEFINDRLNELEKTKKAYNSVQEEFGITRPSIEIEAYPIPEETEDVEALIDERNILFASLCNVTDDFAFKTKDIADKTKFMAGILTNKGLVSYHLDLKYWDYFHVVELDKALAADETTKEQNRDRLISIFSKDKQYRK